jgi:hypothetical protein
LQCVCCIDLTTPCVRPASPSLSHPTPSINNGPSSMQTATRRRRLHATCSVVLGKQQGESSGHGVPAAGLQLACGRSVLKKHDDIIVGDAKTQRLNTIFRKLVWRCRNRVHNPNTYNHPNLKTIQLFFFLIDNKAEPSCGNDIKSTRFPTKINYI